MRRLALLALALPLLAQDGARNHPLEKDRTGIRWVYPFRKALETARKEKRPLLLLPLAGGTNSAGNW